jgi:hypothetical protein
MATGMVWPTIACVFATQAAFTGLPSLVTVMIPMLAFVQVGPKGVTAKMTTATAELTKPVL